MKTKLDDFRLRLGKNEYVPIMIGGMGMDISTSKLVLEAARLGGIAHLSDALISAVTDRHFGTNYIKERAKKYKKDAHLVNKLHAQFDLEETYRAVRLLVEDTMEKKQGKGGIFLNIMEKLSMANSKGTMQARLNAALDGGIDGISLAAGLHLGSLKLIEDNPRFRHVKIGIIVSSARALKLFLMRAAKIDRMPDYIVVEGPLAGGHLGFKVDNWQTFNLKDITMEVLAYLKKADLNIPVIPAGGVFTGRDAVDFIELGASAVQVATRFTVTREAGFPAKTQQRYFKIKEEEIVVNLYSPTGYPMRMLYDSPCIGTGMRPQCENLGFILDDEGDCSYISAYNAEVERTEGKGKLVVPEKTCLCTYMKTYGTWTCGHMAYRLKETTNQLPDGNYQQLTVAQVWHDYLHSTDHTHIKPPLPKEAQILDQHPDR